LVANSSLFPKKITALAPVPGRPSSRHSVGPLHGGLLEWRRVAVWRIVTECPNGSTLRRDLTATEPRVQGTRRPGQPMTSSDHRRTSDYEHFSTVVAAGYYVASASSGRSTNSRRSAPLAASGSSSLGSARPICADELQSSQAEAEGPKGRAENVVRIPRAAASSETPRSFGRGAATAGTFLGQVGRRRYGCFESIENPHLPQSGAGAGLSVRYPGKTERVRNCSPSSEP
jgi:hypothetical protein